MRAAPRGRGRGGSRGGPKTSISSTPDSRPNNSRRASPLSQELPRPSSSNERPNRDQSTTRGVILSRIPLDQLPSWRNPKTSDKGEYPKRMGDLFQQGKLGRAQERKSAIENGLLSDPDKPVTLDKAIKLVGTCQDMCPAFERVERIHQNMVDGNEKISIPDSERPVPVEAMMVKRFKRSAAGTDDQIPSDIRPPLVLQKTLNYLIDDVVGGTKPLAAVHKFVWDRTRAIRNDFSIQQVTKLDDVKVAIECFELIARFHLVSLHQLSNPAIDNGGFDAYQEREQLSNTLVSLIQYYEDNRKTYRSPCEVEFRSYCIIMEIQERRPDLEDRAQTWPKDIFLHPKIQTALKLHAAAGNSVEPQGPLKPFTSYPIAQNFYGRFWSMVASKQVSYLTACVSEIYFNYVREQALYALWKAFRRHRRFVSKTSVLSWITEALGYDNQEQTQKFCEDFGFKVLERDDGVAYLSLNSVTVMNDSNSRRPQLFSKVYVEKKRYGRPLTALMRGMSMQECKDKNILQTSTRSRTKKAADPDNLFLSDDEKPTAKPKDKTTKASVQANPFGSANPFQSNPFNSGLADSKSTVSTSGTLAQPLSTPSPFYTATFAAQAPAQSNPFSSSKITPSQTITSSPAAVNPFAAANLSTQSSNPLSTPAASLTTSSSPFSSIAVSEKQNNPLAAPTTMTNPFAATPSIPDTPKASSSTQEGPTTSKEESSQAHIKPNPFSALTAPTEKSLATPSDRNTTPATGSASSGTVLGLGGTSKPDVTQEPATFNPFPSVSPQTTPQTDVTKQAQSPSSLTAQTQAPNFTLKAGPGPGPGPVFGVQPPSLFQAPVSKPSSLEATSGSGTQFQPSASGNDHLSTTSASTPQSFFKPTTTETTSKTQSSSHHASTDVDRPSPFEAQPATRPTSGVFGPLKTNKTPSEVPTNARNAAFAAFISGQSPDQQSSQGEVQPRSTPSFPGPGQPSEIQKPTHTLPGASVVNTTPLVPQKPKISQEEQLQKLAEDVALGENGILQQFIEVNLDVIIQKEMQRHKKRQEVKIAKEYRQSSLMKKYAQRWREITPHLRRVRLAKTRRSAFPRLEMEARKRLQKEEEMVKIHAQDVNDRMTLQTTTPTGTTRSISRLGSADQPPSRSHSLQASSSPSITSADDNSTRPSTRRITRYPHRLEPEYDANTEQSPALPRKRRSRAGTLLEQRMRGYPETHEEVIERLDPDGLIHAKYHMLLADPSTISPNERASVIKRYQYIYRPKCDQTRTDYFRLKSRGIDPDTPTVPETRKRSHEVEVVDDEPRKTLRSEDSVSPRSGSAGSIYEGRGHIEEPISILDKMRSIRDKALGIPQSPSLGLGSSLRPNASLHARSFDAVRPPSSRQQAQNPMHRSTNSLPLTIPHLPVVNNEVEGRQSTLNGGRQHGLSETMRLARDLTHRMYSETRKISSESAWSPPAATSPSGGLSDSVMDEVRKLRESMADATRDLRNDRQQWERSANGSSIGNKPNDGVMLETSPSGTNEFSTGSVGSNSSYGLGTTSTSQQLGASLSRTQLRLERERMEGKENLFDRLTRERAEKAARKRLRESVEDLGEEGGSDGTHAPAKKAMKQEVLEAEGWDNIARMANNSFGALAQADESSEEETTPVDLFKGASAEDAIEL